MKLLVSAGVINAQTVIHFRHARYGQMTTWSESMKWPAKVEWGKVRWCRKGDDNGYHGTFDVGLGGAPVRAFDVTDYQFEEMLGCYMFEIARRFRSEKERGPGIVLGGTKVAIIFPPYALAGHYLEFSSLGFGTWISYLDCSNTDINTIRLSEKLHGDHVKGSKSLIMCR